jgi:hypothetical protein
VGGGEERHAQCSFFVVQKRTERAGPFLALRFFDLFLGEFVTINLKGKIP